jgi:hypothetical protein
MLLSCDEPTMHLILDHDIVSRRTILQTIVTMKVMRMLFQEQANKAHKVILMTFDNHVVGLGKLEWEMFLSLRVHRLNLIGEAMKNNGN